MQKNHNIIVKIGQSGWTLVEILIYVFPEFSKKQCKRLIDTGIVAINGKICSTTSYILSHRDNITLYLSLQRERGNMQCAFTIIAEYPEFIVCNKPIGFLSSSETISDALGQKIDIVHRLDMETSGIILVAKTPAMHRDLSSLFRLRKIQKEYVAIVLRAWEKESGTLTGRFQRISELNAKSVWTGKSNEGSLGITDFRVMKRSREFALLHLQPYTGRTHQLRVHCSESGFPIVGDYHYGSTIVAPRIYLHAYALQFKNPQTGKDVHHLSPIPREFKALLRG